MLNDEISLHNKKVIEKFVDTFLSNSGEGFALEVPTNMMVGSPDADGWAEWKPVDSPLKESDLAKIEECLGHSLPDLFKAYLLYKCLLMTDFVVRLPQTPSNEPLKEFNQYLALRDSNLFFGKNMLVPFAYDANDAGPACFDVSISDTNDYPVVIVDMGRTHVDGYRGEKGWRNFEELLNVIMQDMESYN
ncbi:hypothetical protein OLMES_3301 [Oleiphilus messinensis]|uniref:Knr4/Smi1-like domain-containing protein n=1 Tax=Oleiphilus messinensis TaxID=141451 RepID=A0A1Y0I9Z0_9GAMM|nr:SMI1/KNR4 family protein [Oleiphilus messinensis]ARU57342.1 hypothetical protein OLMES_3301 [Oleiphilus messinensis]